MLDLLRQIAEGIRAEGGTAYFVGGYVRDTLRGLPSVDYDVEVHGLALDRLEALLEDHGRTEAVGRAFGVLKLFTRRGEADFSLPRRESRQGRGHRGFLVDLDPSITPREACARRDFTVNAMLMDVLSSEVQDYFGGREDLAAKILRHTSPAFDEDPLRAYRLMQLAARLEFSPAPETLELCQDMELGTLAPERVCAEFEKLLLLAQHPSLGLEAGREAGVLAYHPELEDLVGCPQDSEWHPEGDVWEHTLRVVDAAARLRGELRGRRRQMAFMLGALCHDFGKPLATRRRAGRLVSPGHAEIGIEPTRRFLERLTQERELIEDVEAYVLYHLRPAELYRVRDQVHDGSVRRLATQINIQDLVRLARADHMGSGLPAERGEVFPAGDWLLAKAAELEVQDRAPEPLLMGRHLLERGWREGPRMGSLLKQAYEAQLEGLFSDLAGALEWLSRQDGAPQR